MKSQPPAARVRPSWSGMLRFGLVAFPLQAFNAHIERAGNVHFHQLHRKCHRRIRYEKHCPEHGRVSNDEIVMGYEVSKDTYVEVSSDELKALRDEQKRTLTIDTFIRPQQIDPIYFDGRMYLLVPDGADAEEPFSIFLAALAQRERAAVGNVIMSGKDQLALIRPYAGLLHMALLNHTVEIRSAKDLRPPKSAVKATDKKLKLAGQLIDAWGKERFDFSKYEDEYLERVNNLLKEKISEQELVTRPAEEDHQPDVVNLMEALRASLKRSPTASASRRSPRRHGAKRKRAS